MAKSTFRSNGSLEDGLDQATQLKKSHSQVHRDSVTSRLVELERVAAAEALSRLGVGRVPRARQEYDKSIMMARQQR